MNRLIQTKIRQASGKVRVLILIGLLGAAALLAGCAHHPGEAQTDPLEQTWGVRTLSIHLTGAEHFLDFRYQVVDAQKASQLTQRNHQAYLVDEASGKVLPVPVTKLGPMRGTTVMPQAGRSYVILFANTYKTVSKGSKVTVVIGDFKAEHLEVL